MEKITDYIRGISFADIESRLDELHYNQILNDNGKGGHLSSQDRYETAFALNFVKGLMKIVKKKVKRDERKREKRKAA